MTVYRLGYNPTGSWGWSFKDQLKEAHEALNAFAKGHPHRTRWSCGANVAIGDELFLIRLGDSQPRGLVGHGCFTSPSERTGVRRFHADVEFDALVLFGPPIIPMADLGDIPHHQDWSNQSTSTTIKEQVIEPLRKLWIKATTDLARLRPPEGPAPAPRRTEP